MKKTTIWTGVRHVTRREFVGRALATGVALVAGPRLPAGPEPQQQAEHRVHRRGRARQRQPQRADAQPRGATQAHRRQRAARQASRRERRRALRHQPGVARFGRRPRYPQAKKFTDLRKVFDDPKPSTPSWSSTAEHTHVFATYLALTHGKHVYCEKPLAYNIWETRLIRETSRRYPEAVDADGQPGARLADAPQDQGDPRHRRHRHGATKCTCGPTAPGACRMPRRPRSSTSRTGSTTASRSSIGSRKRCPCRRTSTGTCGSGRRRSGRSTPRTSRGRAGIAGGISATAR